jgi:hypothetical protein
VNENEVYNLQLKIKFTFRKDLNKQQLLLLTTGRTALLRLSRVIGDDPAACSATKHDLGDRQTVLAHQGGAVVPGDDETSHEEIRPGTHLLVRTEVSRLILVG